jgi:hypothetical protein
MDYTLLAPALEPQHTKLMVAATNAAHLHHPTTVTDTMPASGYVLSVGKAALDIWHDFGLIQVGANHGDVFTTRRSTGTCVVMVVKHPGEMAQMQFSVHKAHSAREDMVRDLTRWRLLLEGSEAAGGHDHGFHSPICGGCMKLRDSRVRAAEFWVDELDRVGLCDDHYRRRGKYNRKRKTVPVKDRGKIEYQVPGQRQMFADGERVMVDKR